MPRASNPPYLEKVYSRLENGILRLRMTEVLGGGGFSAGICREGAVIRYLPTWVIMHLA